MEARCVLYSSVLGRAVHSSLLGSVLTKYIFVAFHFETKFTALIVIFLLIFNLNIAYLTLILFQRVFTWSAKQVMSKDF